MANQSNTITPGRVYNLFDRDGRTMVDISADSPEDWRNALERGHTLQLHGYSDPKYVIARVLRDGTDNCYGVRYACIQLDTGRKVVKDAVAIRQDNTPYGISTVWRDDLPKVPDTEIDALEIEANRLETEERETKDAKAREQEEVNTRGREILASLPSVPVAFLVAELEQDDCDSMSDYYNSKTVDSYLLAFSDHTRDIFSEMRKAAIRFEHTKHLADMGKDAEHREKYSMGAGYYLKAVSRYRTGWKVEKCNTSYSERYLINLLGRGKYVPELFAKSPPVVATSVDKPTYSLNAEKNGVEIRFPTKPSPEVLEGLKACGYRWSRPQSLWYAKQSEKTIELAKMLTQ